MNYSSALIISVKRTEQLNCGDSSQSIHVEDGQSDKRLKHLYLLYLTEFKKMPATPWDLISDFQIFILTYLVTVILQQNVRLHDTREKRTTGFVRL